MTLTASYTSQSLQRSTASVSSSVEPFVALSTGSLNGFLSETARIPFTKILGVTPEVSGQAEIIRIQEVVKSANATANPANGRRLCQCSMPEGVHESERRLS